MRLMTWNCRVGGFRYKARHIASFRPDVLAVQEVEPIDSLLLFDGECQPTFRDRVSDPAFPRRAVGVFSYTETEVKPVDSDDTLYGFRRYEAKHGGLEFNVVAVWTSATNWAATSYMQAHDGVALHAEWMRQRPTIVLGDFNDNASWKKSNWTKLLDLVAPLDLVSAYHQKSGERFGEETQPTYFHHGKDRVVAHLDYCFVPTQWAARIKDVRVHRFEDWQTVSDHLPLIVDLELPLD